MRERHTTIKFDAFGQYSVIVIIASDLGKAIESRLEDLKESTVPEDIEECKAITYHRGGEKESIIFLRRHCTVADIVHECWHVIYRLFDYFGAELEDECVAYHLDYLVQQTFNFVKKSRTQ